MTESTPELQHWIDDFTTAHNRLMRASAADFLKLVTAQIFDKYPQIKALTWDQYTPYFADGEPCEFGVYQDYGLTRNRCLNGTALQAAADVDPSDDDYEDGDFYCPDWIVGGPPEPSPEDEPIKVREYFSEHYEEALTIDEKAAKAVLRVVPDELYRRLFGDHVSVYVYRGGIATREYSRHD